jgi:hypothetical protein
MLGKVTTRYLRKVQVRLRYVRLLKVNFKIGKIRLC